MLKAFNNEIYRWRVNVQFSGYTNAADRECDLLRRILLEEIRAADMQNGRIKREALLVVDKLKKAGQIKGQKKFQGAKNRVELLRKWCNALITTARKQSNACSLPGHPRPSVRLSKPRPAQASPQQRRRGTSPARGVGLGR
jgi:hypothetical protein